jgi:hypothetical protein
MAISICGGMDGSIGFCFSLVFRCYLDLGAALVHCSCTVREIFDTTAKDYMYEPFSLVFLSGLKINSSYVSYSIHQSQSIVSIDSRK